MRKRGRPKGSEKTVIGLPRKKCGNIFKIFLWTEINIQCNV